MKIEQIIKGKQYLLDGKNLVIVQVVTLSNDFVTVFDLTMGMYRDIKRHQLTELPSKKDLNFYKINAKEDYLITPISVLRYISELEKELEFDQLVKPRL